MKLKLILAVLVAIALTLGVSSLKASAQRVDITGGYNNTGHHPKHIIKPDPRTLGGYNNTGHHPKRMPVLDRRTLGGYNNTGYHLRPSRFVPHSYGGYQGRGSNSYSCGTYMQGGKRCYR